ncbi:MAG: hypothetical protein FJZ47_06805 [Candidatus Tectomicrobia bacterium]|uniref:Uncharacterized protein n=1 Tax=Tectimicrobiota bacterium TaxID=2528274 RepID=A0A937W1B7_UNCTE|nr:hypothetical protein [Candidatus Tectomicrobia bacterium]
MRWQVMCLALLGSVLVSLAFGATLRHPEEAKELAEKILGRASVGDMDGIVKVIKPYWPFPDEELETVVAQTAQQRTQLSHRLGKSVGFTLVRREFAADTFLRLIYVERFENSGLRWMFTFYKVKDAWKFNNFTWDEDISKLFPSSPQPR